MIPARDVGLNWHGYMVHGRSFIGVATYSPYRGGLNVVCIRRSQNGSKLARMGRVY